MSDKIKVMMTTEGTYPFHHGGASTWCDILVNNLNDNFDFVVYSIIMNPFVTQKFGLPDNTELIKVPLWGTEEPSEHLGTSFSKIYNSRRKTVDKVIRDSFIPLFIDLIEEIISYEKNPIKFGNTLLGLYKYFQEYEYKKSFKSEITWKVYKDFILRYSSNIENRIAPPGVYSTIQSLGWIYRFMTILNTPIPKVDVTHSAAAAFCGIPCVLSKLENNTPFMLTEHGVYLREQYLSLSQRGYNSFLNTFLIRMIHSVVNLNYAYADQISPVCDYNTRWERRFGVESKKIQVIYNGVDKDVFVPKPSSHKRVNPTIVSVARIDPVKDIISLIKAADIVKKQIPDVKFVVYGSVTVPDYYDECLKIKNELNMNDTFIFAGHTNDVAAAYLSGDIIALSSITEAFPYSVVEAMLVGKPVIATDVGGIKEALGDTGILVSPRKPEEMAKGIINLLKSPELRATLSEEARERALNYFTLKTVQELHHKSYMKLALKSAIADSKDEKIGDIQLSNRKNKQKLLVEKGYALLEHGYLEQAVKQLKMAIQEEPSSPAVPFVLTKIADIYNALGEYDNALNEMERAQILMNILNSERTA
jgi:polysaccharide biosynthesis protein PelF